MVRRTVMLALLVGGCFISVVFAADPNCRDKYTVPGREHMFRRSLSGLRQAYEIFNAGVDDSNCSDNRELMFLHAVTRTAMLFIDNNDLSVKDSFLELAEEFGVEVLGDYFEFLDVNVPLTPDGCYEIPLGAPDADEIYDVIHNSIIPEINDIIAELDSISDSPVDRFRIFFKPNETGLENDLEVDYGEVLILKGLLLALKAQLEAQLAYDLFVEVNGEVKIVVDNLFCGEDPDVDFNINKDFLKRYPDLLKVLPTRNYPDVDGAAILAQSRQNLIDSINYYFAAVDYITSENDPLGTDPQENELVYIDPNDTFLLDVVKEKLITLRDSLENDTIATYPAQTTKTYNIYDSSSTVIGQLVLVYDFAGFEGEDGSLTFTDGTASPWEIEWFGREGSSELEVDVEYYSPTEWREGYFEGTISSGGNSITGATFEYWGSAWGTLNNLSGQLISTEVVDVNVDLNPIFGNTARYPDPVKPRDLLPQFDAENEPLAGTFGHGLGDNATLGGILPDMTQTDWINLFDLPTPDLTGEFGTITLPEMAVPGDKGTVPIVVTNTGAAMANGKIAIDMYASLDQTLDGNDIKLAGLNQAVKLLPGKSKTCKAKVVIPNDLLPGEYYMLAHVDASNTIVESNEDNNVAVTDGKRGVVWKFGSFAGRKNVKLTVADGQKTPVTFLLKGGGYGEIIGGSDLTQVVLNDTTDKSLLLIKTKGKGAITSVGDVNVVNGPLKGILAKTTDLRGDITIDGSLGILLLHDIADDHTITIGPSVNPKAGLLVKVNKINDLTIDSNTPIKLLIATEWNGGSLTAPSVSNISIKGDLTDVNITLNQALDAKLKALSKMTVKGWIRGSRISTLGNIGTITAGAIENSSCFAGVTKSSDENGDGVLDLPSQAGDIGKAIIKSLKIKGIKGEPNCVINSNIAAAELGTVYIVYPEYYNSDVPFGVAADFIKKVTLKDADGTNSWSKLGKPAESIKQNDVEIRLF